MSVLLPSKVTRQNADRDLEEPARRKRPNFSQVLRGPNIALPIIQIATVSSTEAG